MSTPVAIPKTPQVGSYGKNGGFDYAGVNGKDMNKWGSANFAGSFYNGLKEKVAPETVATSLRLLVQELAVLHAEASEDKSKQQASPVIAQILDSGIGASITLEDIEQYLTCDHPAEDCYGRRPVYVSDHMEVMLMTWIPGDQSACHDHGITECGAARVLGPGSIQHTILQQDHAVGLIRTQSVDQHFAGEVLEINHDLVHAMGTKETNRHTCTLHVYMTFESYVERSVTGNARVMDMVTRTTHLTDGGVFHALPTTQVNGNYSTEYAADSATLLRDGSELCTRLLRMPAESRSLTNSLPVSTLAERLFSAQRQTEFWRDTEALVNSDGYITNSSQWQLMCGALREAAKLQSVLQTTLVGTVGSGEDRLADSARTYDALIGQPCIDGFMRRYLKHFFESMWGPETGRPVEEARVLSVGCSTGLVEKLMVGELGVAEQNLSCFDISPAMVETVRRERGLSGAHEGDTTMLTPEEYGTYDVVYAGLNIYQDLPFDMLDESLRRAAECTRPGGYFVSDFISTDHMRSYPNLVRSGDGKSASLRTPQLVEKDYRMYLQSDIINVTWDTPDGSMRIHDSGVHSKWVVPMQRILNQLSKHFSAVNLMDAHSLELMSEDADTCPSTRFVVVARK